MDTIFKVLKYVLIALPFILNLLGVENSEAISALTIDIVGYLGMAIGGIWAIFDETAGMKIKQAIEDILDEFEDSGNSSEVAGVTSYEAGVSKLRRIKTIALKAVKKAA